MGFNGTVPGPEIRVNPGDHVRIILRNEMTQPTILHFHGLTVPNDMDGVPFITQDPILPGGFFVYEFDVVDRPGMYVYHSHFDSTEQVGKGLYGAFYVQPKGGDWSRVYDQRIDVESTLFLGDGPTGYVLNGKEFPATQPIAANLGDEVLIHPRTTAPRSIRCTCTASISRWWPRTGSCSTPSSATWPTR